MTLLQTDDQTIEDLGIFGKKNDSGIYDIYNRSNTHGGEMLLQEIFRNPLSDKEAINRRSSIIAHFGKLSIPFPYNASLFDAVEKYLSSVEESTKNKHHPVTLGEKEIQNGVGAVIEIIRLTKNFIEREEVKDIHAYAVERELIAALIGDAAFDPVLKEQPKGKLSYSAVTAYDALFRISERQQVEKLLGYIYYLDIYMSVAATAMQRKFVFPKALDKGSCELNLDGVYHPSLKKPITNDVSMDTAGNVIFLTGANMAGKSTFLRSLSTALYIAHMGFPVAARSMEFSVMDGIYTTINLPDNLGIGASHFYMEVLRVKKVAAALSTGKSFFILFDELFRGTNVKDAHEATVAVTKGFAANRNSMFIISSHIVEAGDELKQEDNISFLYLPTHMNGHVPAYTYKLEQGITEDRHGMIIIHNEGILETLKNGKKQAAGAKNKTGFSTDKQTLDELNLLGKFRHDSVYHLFNRVKTRGGEQLLDKMFRHPLTDAAAINERSSIFRIFQQAAPAFPFDVEQLYLMQEYLDVGVSKNAALVLAGTFVKKWLSVLTRDQRYKKKVQGLQATIITLNRCYSFVQSFRSAGGAFTLRLNTIRELLSDKRLGQLRNVDIYKALSVSTLAYYDHLLKFRLLKEMQALLSFIYEIDVNIAVSQVAHNKGFHYATALPAERNVCSVKGLRHPCIDRAVSNDLLLAESNNILFLTGANMAGKSTLMKSVGIGMYMAHMGFPVAAVEMEFSVREGLYSSINVADNIGLGYSHFYAEVVRVKQAADAAASGKRLLLLFDELFKGTNVKDAYDGTLAVTEGFAAYRECLFIVSTHIIEVSEALKERPNVHFVYMPTVMDGVHPRYTYRLENGITSDRQGMMIIRNEGILELLNKQVKKIG